MKYRDLAKLAAALWLGCGAPEEGQEPPVSRMRQAYGTRQADYLGLGAAVSSPDLRVVNGSLQVNQGGTWLEGPALIGQRVAVTDFNGGANPIVSITIRNVVAHPPPARPGTSPNPFEYTIETTVQSGLTLQPCVDQSSATTAALALPGLYGTDGRYNGLLAGGVTFGCLNSGVIAKCLDWGYRPWLPIPEKTIEACTRMAMADYCGDGVGHTFPGTDIEIYDFGITTPPINTRDRTTLSVEAIWVFPFRGIDPGQPFYPSSVLCLGKKRWDTLPINGYCGAKIPDPRLRPSATGGACGAPPTGSEPRFCEERTLDEWLALARQQFAEAAPNIGLLVNDSSYNDAGLVRWRSSSTGRFFTTTRYDANRCPIGAHTCSRLSSTNEFYCAEGKVVRNTAPFSARAGLPALRTYRSFFTGAYYTTTRTTAPAGFYLESVEGYIYPAKPLPNYPVWPPPGSAALYSWQVSPGHYVTTTEATARPSSAVLEGYLPLSLPCVRGR
jgi:hypothetical protein